MNKNLSLFLINCLLAGTISAQEIDGNVGQTSQTVQLNLSPVIGIKFSNTNSSSGSLINMNFQNIAQMNEGLISGEQELIIQSNKNFKISVQTDASNFNYLGDGNANLPVQNTLFLAIKGNTTGGAIPSNFNNNFQSLSNNSQDVVLDANQGSDQRISFNYKAKPGLNHPAGSYTVGVIYTATQP